MREPAGKCWIEEMFLSSSSGSERLARPCQKWSHKGGGEGEEGQKKGRVQLARVHQSAHVTCVQKKKKKEKEKEKKKTSG